MALFHDTSIISDMAMLSLAAYAADLEADKDFHPDLTGGWAEVTGIEADIVKGSYENGVYRHDYSLVLVKNTAVAIVAQKGDALAISLRGSAADVRQKKGTTSIVDDWVATSDYQSKHFKALREVVEAALKFAADDANGISTVYVTGHSLGGAMAEFVAARYALFEDILPVDKVRFVTFGSPGVARTNANPLDLLVEQIGHSKDPIFEQDVPIFDLSGLTRAEDRITIELPFVPGGLIGFPATPVPQHRMVQYQDTAEALVGSALTFWADRHFRIAVGREKDPVEGIDTFGHSDSSQNQFLVGRNGQEILNGGKGHDLLDGGGADDLLRGAQGNDRLNGGPGADTLAGGAGFDYAHYNLSPQGLTVSLADPSANTGEAAGDVFRSIEGLYGSRFADLLRGDTGDNILVGNLGADTLRGGAGLDSAGYMDAASRVVADLLDSSRNTGEAKGDVYISIEGLIGSAFNDTLTGDTRGNRLDGGAGNDMLAGGLGNDTLVGLDGRDRFVFDTELDSRNNVDTIEDFELSGDRIVLDRLIFENLLPGPRLTAAEFHIGPKPTDEDIRIVYKAKTGALFYFEEGSASESGLRFAFLDADMALLNTHFLIV